MASGFSKSHNAAEIDRLVLVLAKEPGSKAFIPLAEEYGKAGMWQEAADGYKEALRLRRRRNDWRLALGKAYANLGRKREAEQKYREILSLSPDDADALKALQELGKKY